MCCQETVHSGAECGVWTQDGKAVSGKSLGFRAKQHLALFAGLPRADCAASGSRLTLSELCSLTVEMRRALAGMGTE